MTRRRSLLAELVTVVLQAAVTYVAMRYAIEQIASLPSFGQ